MNEKTQVVVESTSHVPAQVVSLNPEAIIMKGLDTGVPVETLERLLAMRETLKAEQAKEAFFSALSAFQSDCPIIKKTKQVKGKNGQVRYSYAPLDSIIEQVSELLKTHGLSYIFKAEYPDGAIIQHCVIHHTSGHAETSSFSIPIDPDAFMGDAQKSGSASSFAKRYAFTNGFGILTGDQDDDGQSVGGGVDANDLYRKFSSHMAAVMDNFETVLAVKDGLHRDDLDSAAEAWAEILNVKTVMSLSLAPTKGGCFTIEERKKMASDEWKELMIKHRDGREMEGL